MLNIMLHDIDIFLSNLAYPPASETLPDSATFYPSIIDFVTSLPYNLNLALHLKSECKFV